MDKQLKLLLFNELAKYLSSLLAIEQWVLPKLLLFAMVRNALGVRKMEAIALAFTSAMISWGLFTLYPEQEARAKAERRQ